MRIHQLEKSKGLKDKQRRRWRGNATGTGNYSGRGLKGQKSRSGHSMKPFFEWGQTSIVQRLPKARGFKRYYKLVKKVTIINLNTLDADVRIADAANITKELLKELGYIKTITDVVKILGHGDYAKKLTFTDMNAISASAQKKIDNPGTVHAVPRKAPVKIIKTIKKSSVKKIETPKKASVKVEKAVEEKKVPAKKPAVKPLIAEEKKVPAKKPAVKKAPAKVSSKVTTKKTK